MTDTTDIPTVSMANTKKELLEAYEKVQDIANRAVTASRRESYPAPVHHSAASGRDDSQALK